MKGVIYMTKKYKRHFIELGVLMILPLGIHLWKDKIKPRFDKKKRKRQVNH